MRALVVFDLDGTLVDSREDLAASVNQVIVDLGGRPLPVGEVSAMVGDGARVLVSRALSQAGLNADLDAAHAAFHRAYDARLVDVTRPYHGIDDVLRALAPQAALAVLTNKPLAPSRRVLDAFGWTTTFGQVIGGDGVYPRKSDPAGLRALIEWAGATPESTLMVGDSILDVETARRAGVGMCVASWGFGSHRGDLVLHGDEFLADRPADVLTAWDHVRQGRLRPGAGVTA